MDLTDRAQAHSPALVGLLARLAGVSPPSNAQPVATRLAQWIDWPQAVALASALEPRPAPPAHGAPLAVPDGNDECMQLRATLVATIEGDRAFAAPGAGAAPEPAFFRQRYVALQQVMEGEVGLVRKRLRDRLARGAPGRRQLAAVDAVMERALGSRERALLATLPDLLLARADPARAAAPPDSTAGDTPPAPARLISLRSDMKALLLAELGLRLQPVQALAAALRDANRIRHD